MRLLELRKKRDITPQFARENTNALKANAERLWNQNWKMVSAVFVRVAALRTKSSI